MIDATLQQIYCEHRSGGQEWSHTLPHNPALNGCSILETLNLRGRSDRFDDRRSIGAHDSDGRTDCQNSVRRVEQMAIQCRCVGKNGFTYGPTGAATVYLLVRRLISSVREWVYRLIRLSIWLNYWWSALFSTFRFESNSGLNSSYHWSLESMPIDKTLNEVVKTGLIRRFVSKLCKHWLKCEEKLIRRRLKIPFIYI